MNNIFSIEVQTYVRTRMHLQCSVRWLQCAFSLALELCLKNLQSLSSIGLISMDEDVNIKPTGEFLNVQLRSLVSPGC